MCASVTFDLGLEGKQVNLEEIPIIDISDIQDAEGKKVIAENIKFACRNIGFFYVTGHSVPQQEIDVMFTMAKDYFALPEEEKQKQHLKYSGRAMRGYTPFFGENVNPGKTQDLKECFDFGPETDADKPFHGANLWTNSLPEMETVMMRYHDQMVSLSKKLVGMIALSLGQSEDFFADKMRSPISLQRILHYPSQEGQISEETLGCGAHTDYGSLTILAQDTRGGLQVQNLDGEWIAATPVPGAFVVNIGDLIQRWSNDFLKANWHRVINVSGKDRYSIPFFIDADFDAEIKCLDSCVNEDKPANYETVTCGAHKLRRYGESFVHLKAAE